MSGGTWDYQQFRLKDLADDLRDGVTRWTADGETTLEFPRARVAMANLLDTVSDLIHELDWYFAGDSLIEDETAWMNAARQRLEITLISLRM